MKYKPKFNIRRLIDARLLKGWSRAQLAVKINRTENMVWKVENGSRTSERTIFAMSKALGVPMEEILITKNGPNAA